MCTPRERERKFSGDRSLRSGECVCVCLFGPLERKNLVRSESFIRLALVLLFDARIVRLGYGSHASMNFCHASIRDGQYKNKVKSMLMRVGSLRIQFIRK